MSRNISTLLLQSSETQGSKRQTRNISRRSRRRPKFSPMYQKYMAEVREARDKITTRHWRRSFSGEVVTHAHISASISDEAISENFNIFRGNLTETRGYKDQNEIKFDSDPQEKTPKKAISVTPRKRKFKNTTTARIEFLDKDWYGEKIRVVSFQEDKFAVQIDEKSPQFGDAGNLDREELEKFSKRLSGYQDKQDKSIIKMVKNISKQSIARSRKRKSSSESSKDKLSLSADDICAYYLQDLSCPLDEQQRLVQKNSHHELSHLVARSQGGGLITLPTTEGHNSKRIPIEILAPFFIKLGLKVQFETIDNLLSGNNGEVILLPHKETIIITLPEIQRRITFELDPLCPEQPVHGCYDIAKQIALLALSGTAYLEPAQKLLEKQNKRKKYRSAKAEIPEPVYSTPSKQSKQDSWRVGRRYSLFPSPLDRSTDKEQPDPPKTYII